MCLGLPLPNEDNQTNLTADFRCRKRIAQNGCLRSVRSLSLGCCSQTEARELTMTVTVIEAGAGTE